MLPPQKMAPMPRATSPRSVLGRVLDNHSTPVLMAASAVVGALSAAALGAFVPRPWAESSAPLPDSCPGVHNKGLTFFESPAMEALGELSVDEVRSVARWFAAAKGATGTRNASADCVWLAGPSAVELLRPPKDETVAFLDRFGPRPLRYARVTAVGPNGVEEYKVGPIEGGAVVPDATAELLRGGNDVPYTKRPTETNADNRISMKLLNRTIQDLAPLLIPAFGPVWPQIDGFDERYGSVSFFNRNDALRRPGERVDMLIFQWSPPAPVRVESTWLHPAPLMMKLNTTAQDHETWNVFDIYFCGQGPFATTQQLVNEHAAGKIVLCALDNVTGTWDVPQQTTKASKNGRKFVEANKGVSWGPWSFSVAQRPSTGVSLVDVRFRGERIVYEIAAQDAMAAYSGDESTQFFYADASWSLSMLSASLLPGVDCPEGAHYVSAANWMTILPEGVAEADAMNPYEFYPTCIFEFTEDHTVWRHMQNDAPPDVRGLLRKTVVVRSIATVGNYDYITDVKMREDGEIEVFTRFCGFIESRWFNRDRNPEEANFSTIVHPGLAGPVHSHMISFKVDIDVAGVRKNAFKVSRVKVREVPGGTTDLGVPRKKMLSKYLEHTIVPKEGVNDSAMFGNPMQPTTWSIIDQHSVSKAGNPRGWALTLNSWSTGQVLPADHPFTKAMPSSKYHIAVTRYHDDEYRSSEVYAQYDSANAIVRAQDLDRFLEDGESLIDQDLVAWVCVGREHIVRQEDLPLVSNFGAGFSLQPWNFFAQNVAASPPWGA